VRVLEVPDFRMGETPKHGRMIYQHDGNYYGWTGSNYFGVIRHIDGVWVVTGAAEVFAWVYGSGLATVRFPNFDDAVREVEDLMDIMDHG
jgi:hypothetical protein